MHAQFIAAIQTISKQNDDNNLQQTNNTLNSPVPKTEIDSEDITNIEIYPKDITRLIRFLICMDLIDRDRFINDNTIKSSGYYYPWYLKHHIFTQPFYRGLGGTKQFIS